MAALKGDLTYTIYYLDDVYRLQTDKNSYSD
jgi:hypothetical protein